MQDLVARLTSALDDDPRVRILCGGSSEQRVGVMSFVIDGFEAAEMGAILDESFGICVRPGLHCAPYVHRTLGTAPDGAIRASFARSNSEEDVDALVAALREIIAG